MGDSSRSRGYCRNIVKNAVRLLVPRKSTSKSAGTRPDQGRNPENTSACSCRMLISGLGYQGFGVTMRGFPATLSLGFYGFPYEVRPRRLSTSRLSKLRQLVHSQIEEGWRSGVFTPVGTQYRPLSVRGVRLPPLPLPRVRHFQSSADPRFRLAVPHP